MASSPDPPRPLTEEAKTRLEALVRREREAFGAEEGESALALWLGGLERLLDFLEITGWEYVHANDHAVESARRAVARPPGTWKLTREEQLQWEADRVNSIVLHLRIETFYLFADILLHRLAKTFEFHFGEPESKGSGPRLTKHEHMKTNLTEFAVEKELSEPPDELTQLARKLGKQITTYRNRSIVHANDLRRVRGTIINGLNEEAPQAAIPDARAFPREDDPRPTTSGAPQTLLRLITEYVVAVVDYIDANFDRIKDVPEPAEESAEDSATERGT